MPATTQGVFTMQTQTIALNQLHVSPLNMRAEKKEPSLKKMAEIAANILPTVREKGILSDLIVRQNSAGYEILAGRRRYYAAKVIEKERGEFPPLPCDALQTALAAFDIDGHGDDGAVFVPRKAINRAKTGRREAAIGLALQGHGGAGQALDNEAAAFQAHRQQVVGDPGRIVAVTAGAGANRQGGLPFQRRLQGAPAAKAMGLGHVALGIGQPGGGIAAAQALQPCPGLAAQMRQQKLGRERMAFGI
jgi:ParB family chromosome partitioning protein